MHCMISFGWQRRSGDILDSMSVLDVSYVGHGLSFCIEIVTEDNKNLKTNIRRNSIDDINPPICQLLPATSSYYTSHQIQLDMSKKKAFED